MRVCTHCMQLCCMRRRRHDGSSRVGGVYFFRVFYYVLFHAYFNVSTAYRDLNFVLWKNHVRHCAGHYLVLGFFQISAGTTMAQGFLNLRNVPKDAVSNVFSAERFARASCFLLYFPLHVMSLARALSQIPAHAHVRSSHVRITVVTSNPFSISRPGFRIKDTAL